MKKGPRRRESAGESGKVVAPLRSVPIHTSITTPEKESPELVSPHESPGDLHGFCGGHDVILGWHCLCTDLALQLTLRAATLATIRRAWVCLCCELPVNINPPGPRPLQPDPLP